MNILICAAEMAPLVKVGGLADVTGSLSRALAQSGHRVGVILPLYGSIDRHQHNIKRSEIAFDVSVKGDLEPARVWVGKSTENVDLFLIEHEGNFGLESVYFLLLQPRRCGAGEASRLAARHIPLPRLAHRHRAQPVCQRSEAPSTVRCRRDGVHYT